MSAADAVTVTVRQSCGAYLASALGKRASCTESSERAAQRLAEKLGFGSDAACELLAYESSTLQRYSVSRAGTNQATEQRA